MDEDAAGRWGEEVEDGDVEGPGQGDEVVGGELADPVAGDGAFGVGDHRFAPFLAGHCGEQPGDLGLGEPAALAQPDEVAGDDLVGGPGRSGRSWLASRHRGPCRNSMTAGGDHTVVIRSLWAILYAR